MNTTQAISVAFATALALHGVPAAADHGSIGFGIGTASPIITNTAITLPVGMGFVSALAQFVSFNQLSTAKLQGLHEYFDATGQQRDVHNVGSLVQPVLLGGYGFTDNFTLAAYMPYVYRNDIKTFSEDTGRVESLGGSNGIGDFRVFGEYRFFHTADNLSNVTAIFMVKAPTGITDRVSRFLSNGSRELIDVHMQPGSGSWDGGLGASFTQTLGAYSLDANVQYTWVSRGAEDTNLGDIFAYNVALSYALGGPSGVGFLASSNLSKWTAILELNGEWRDKQNTAGVRDPDSGGNIVFVSPGVRWSGGANWNVALSAGAPIVSDVNGYQGAPDYRLIGRVSMSF